MFKFEIERHKREEFRPSDYQLLIICDNNDIHMKAYQILSDDGYQITWAENAQQAFDTIERTRPDMILVDCMFPEEEAREFCRFLRKRSVLNEVPVLFLTARHAKDRKNTIEDQIDDFIIVPVDMDEMRLRVRMHLDLSNYKRQFREQTNRLEEMVAIQSDRLSQVRNGQELLFTNPDDFPEIKAAVQLIPALEAGGDFYEINRLGDSTFGILISDVSGHDLSVAYLTGAMKALACSFMNETLSVDETLMLLNGALLNFLPTWQYATACYVIYNQETRQLDMINAGHPAAIIQKSDGRIFLQEMSGDVLGMFEIIQCERRSFNMEPGDRLFLYTDGLIESWPSIVNEMTPRQLGIEYVKRYIGELSNRPVNQVVHSIVDRLVMNSPHGLLDDVVLMGFEF